MVASSVVGIWKVFDGRVTAVEHRCVVVRNRHASCRRCAQACPSGAIVVEDGSLAVHARLCDGCGRCVQACPTEALLPADTVLPAGTLDRELHVQDDGTLPHFVPERRRDLLVRLGASDRPDDVDLDAARWGTVTIDVDRCESCRMCAVFCPTGAIARFDDEDGTFGLEHTPAYCVQCGSCADVCYTGALSLSACEDVDVLANPRTERIELQPMRYQRGGAHSATNAIRYILGLDTVYER